MAIFNNLPKLAQRTFHIIIFGIFVSVVGHDVAQVTDIGGDLRPAMLQARANGLAKNLTVYSRMAMGWTDESSEIIPGAPVPCRLKPRQCGREWWALKGSNLRPLPCEGNYLAKTPLFSGQYICSSAHRSPINKLQSTPRVPRKAFALGVIHCDEKLLRI